MAVLEGRKRLEATLSSPALTDKDNVFRLVSSQLASSASSPSSSAPVPFSSSSSSLQTDVPNDRSTLHEKEQNQFGLVWSLLELLRSASGEEVHKLEMLAEDGTHNDGWKLKHDTGQFRVMYREGPKGTPFHTLLGEGIVNSPIASALCLAWEAPSYNLWWPQTLVPTFKVTESRWIQRGFNGEDLSLIRLKVPWPLAAREVLMCAFELEVLDEELILVLLHSLPDTEETLHGLKPSDMSDASAKVVRMELAGGFALQKFSSDKSYFRTVANVDIKLDFVPPWVINFISRQLIGLGFKLYEKTLISINKEGSSGHFQKLIETEPMYARIRKALQVNMKIDGEKGSLMKETAQKRPHTGDTAKATKSSKPEEKERLLSKVESLSSNEIAPVPDEKGILAEEGAATTGIAQRRSDAAADLDPEVKEALDVLDKMISLIRSCKVGSVRNDVLVTDDNGEPGSLNSRSAQCMHTQHSGIADNGNKVELHKAPLEQVLTHQTQQPYVSKQTSQLEIKRKWFCFPSSPLCCKQNSRKRIDC